MDESTLKRCSTCNEWKPLSDFYKRGNQCKRCIRAKNRAYYLANRAADAAYKRDYYLARREETIARTQARRAANRAAADEYRRRYYAENREAALEAAKQWARQNPTLRAAHRAVRRANLMAVAVGPVDLDLLWIRQCGVCALCGHRIDRALSHPDPMSRSVDHVVPLAKGGTHEQSNLTWTHLVCNLRKGARLTA